jgi:hypothetical protein
MTPEEDARLEMVAEDLGRMKGTLFKLIGYIESIQLDIYTTRNL